MVDPSKPNEPKRKSLARDALEKVEEKARQNLHENLGRLGTVESKPEQQPRTEDKAWAPLMNSPEMQDFAKNYEEQRRAMTRILMAAGRMPTVSEPSILAKFWKLTENNFFMGGGLGIALAAYAFLLGGAPRFAIALLALSWLVTTVSVYRHKFFQGKSRRVEIVGNMTISAALAIVLLVLWLLLVPPTKSSIPALATDTNKSVPEVNESEGNVFLSEEYPSFGKTKTFTFFGDKHYGALSFQARFGLDNNLMIILLIHSTDTDTRYLAGDCLTAMNNYQAIVDELKSEIRKGQTQFIALDVYPTLICHYDQATDIPQEKIEALKRIASIKHLVLRIEGPNGPK